MAYFIACLMAVLSFLLNRLLLRYIGIGVVISYSPVLEEAAKTLLAHYLGADILVTHITFGIVEAAYDWWQNEQSGTRAAWLSIGGHSLFGLLTVGGLYLTGSIWLGLAGGVLAHIIWNVTMIRLYAGG
jgi:hypothetical protein